MRCTPVPAAHVRSTQREPSIRIYPLNRVYLMLVQLALSQASTTSRPRISPFLAHVPSFLNPLTVHIILICGAGASSRYHSRDLRRNSATSSCTIHRSEHVPICRESTTTLFLKTSHRATTLTVFTPLSTTRAGRTHGGAPHLAVHLTHQQQSTL